MFKFGVPARSLAWWSARKPHAARRKERTERRGDVTKVSTSSLSLSPSQEGRSLLCNIVARCASSVLLLASSGHIPFGGGRTVSPQAKRAWGSLTLTRAIVSDSGKHRGTEGGRQYVTHAACVFLCLSKGRTNNAAAFDVGGKEAVVVVVAQVLTEKGPPSSSPLPEFQDRSQQGPGAPSVQVIGCAVPCVVHPWRTSMPKTIVGGSSSSNRLPHRHSYLPPVPTRPTPPPEGANLGGPSMSG